VQPVLASVDADRAELAGVETQNELIVADIRAMTEIDVRALEAEVQEQTRELPHDFDEAAIFRDIEGIVADAGGRLTRIALTPPTPFVGVPSAAELPEGYRPANTPETLTAAAEAGFVVSTAAIDFDVDSPEQALDVIRELSAADRIFLVASGTVGASTTQRVDAELYFLPRAASDVAIVEGQ